MMMIIINKLNFSFSNSNLMISDDTLQFINYNYYYLIYYLFIYYLSVCILFIYLFFFFFFFLFSFFRFSLRILFIYF